MVQQDAETKMAAQMQRDKAQHHHEDHIFGEGEATVKTQDRDETCSTNIWRSPE